LFLQWSLNFPLLLIGMLQESSVEVLVLECLDQSWSSNRLSSHRWPMAMYKSLWSYPFHQYQLKLFQYRWTSTILSSFWKWIRLHPTFQCAVLPLQDLTGKWYQLGQIDCIWNYFFAIPALHLIRSSPLHQNVCVFGQFN